MTLTRKRNAIRYFESKLDFTLGPAELDHRIKDRQDLVVVDVRRPEDFREGHIPGAINLPREKWATAEGLSRHATNALYCYSQQCHLAAEGCLELSRLGFPVVELEGGIKAWREYGLEVETLERERVRAAA